jgi:hypothetical protein
MASHRQGLKNFLLPTGLFCNRTFDDYACWPDGSPGSFVNVSCPWYLPWASSGECCFPVSKRLGQEGALLPFL